MLPDDMTTAIVTGQYIAGDGTAEQGTITFERVLYLRGTGSDVVLTPYAHEATLDSTGAFSIELPITNDPNYVPVDWSYAVTERFSGHRLRKYDMPLEDDTNIADVSPLVAPLEGTQYALLSQVQEAQADAAEAVSAVGAATTAADAATAAANAATTAAGAADTKATAAATTANAALPKAGGTMSGRLTVGTVFTVDPATGVATQGGKAGFVPLRFCGIKPTGGAPTTGTWEFGDVIMTTTGSTWLCTVAGTPGTWAST